MRLDGAFALVTGAGSGIGQALCVELAWRGARLILVGRRKEALEETAGQLALPAAALIPGDLTRADDIARIASKVGQLSAPLNLLVNNAGLVHPGRFAAQKTDEMVRMIETNLLAPMALTQALLPMLKRASASRIVNVGSMFGDIAFPYFSAYSATKFGLKGWSDALRRELAAEGIGVTYCAPRGTRTPAADGFADLARDFKMKLDPPDLVARRIADGIERDARDVYPKGPERLFLLIQKLFPAAIDKNLAKLRAARPD
jgi:short-subunit dehydrogenase